MIADTSAWIDLLNGNRTAIADRLAEAIQEGDLVLVPALVLTEVLQGLRTEADAARIGDLMTAFPAPPELDTDDYRKAAALYRSCRTRGITPSSTIDCLLAQQCLMLNVPILARDRDFEAIARVAPLRLA
ncbi:MAG: type II toxin-antitoxin system VapC family toxin [Steroidobacteraceae bacterium]